MSTNVFKWIPGFRKQQNPRLVNEDLTEFVRAMTEKVMEFNDAQDDSYWGGHQYIWWETDGSNHGEISPDDFYHAIHYIEIWTGENIQGIHHMFGQGGIENIENWYEYRENQEAYTLFGDLLKELYPDDWQTWVEEHPGRLPQDWNRRDDCFYPYELDSESDAVGQQIDDLDGTWSDCVHSIPTGSTGSSL